MKKLLPVLLCTLLFSITDSFGQSPYYYKTTETLKKEQAEASRSGKSNIVSEINKELAQRKEEQDKIDMLQAELYKKIEVEDFKGAQAIKEQIGHLKSHMAQKDELRKKLESALVIEDYEKAEQHKNELLALNKPSSIAQKQEAPKQDSRSGALSNVVSGDNPNTTPAQPSQPQEQQATSVTSLLARAAENAAPAQPSQSTKPQAKPSAPSQNYSETKGFVAYSLGAYAPIGFSFGMLPRSVGLYFSFRMNGAAIGAETSSYTMTGSGISSSTWDFEYTGNREYRRWSIMGGPTFRLAGTVGKISLHGFGGLGVGSANYMYQYKRYGTGGVSYGTSWVKYEDYSITSLEGESGLILDIYGFNAHLGFSVLFFNEAMPTFGVGYSF